ncbi:sarcoplasmic calcium-binding protein-like [Watersipora subatra]|uniref:sarcoplasmic calcium-binding protein-like n=1 Tax=Watersipora subatra TaxID=2589382 RepID=UPI00355B1A28
MQVIPEKIKRKLTKQYQYSTRGIGMGKENVFLQQPSEHSRRSSLSDGGSIHHGGRRLSRNEDAESTVSMRRNPEEIPPIWRKKMSTWFQRWDADGDGVLTRADFEIFSNRMEEYCKRRGSRERTTGIFIYMWEHFVSPEEPSHIGAVTHDEFIEKHFQARQKWDKNPTISASLIATFGLLFDAIDSSGDGLITMDEYNDFYAIMGIDVTLAAEAFRRIDRKSTGHITRDEFLSTVMAYYCDFEPSETEVNQSLFLGPLVDPTDEKVDLAKHWAHATRDSIESYIHDLKTKS